MTESAGVSSKKPLSPNQDKSPGDFGGWITRLLPVDLLILLLLSALSLVILAPLMVRVVTAEYDEAIFLDIARNIQRVGLPVRSLAESGGNYLYDTPLYVYLLSFLTRYAGESLLLARSVTVVAALAAVAVTYLFGMRAGGRLVGVLAALLLAINPFFLVYSFFVRMEIFMLLGLLVGFYLVTVGIEEDRDGHLLAAGIAFGLAVLFKEFALLGTAIAAAYVFWRRRAALRRGFVGALCVGTPSLLALVAWAAWSWKLSPPMFGAIINRWLNSAVLPATADPRMGMTWLMWVAQLSSRLLGPGLALGLLLWFGYWVLKRGRTEGGLGLLWAYTLGAIALSFFIRLKEPRHLIGVLPAAALLTAYALVRIWEGRHSSLRLPARLASLTVAASVKPVATFAIIAAVLVFAGPLRPPLLPRPEGQGLSWVAPIYAERLAGERFYHLLALSGRRVAEMTAPGEVVTVVHQAPVTAYYADRPYTMLYTLPMPLVTEMLDKAHVLVWDAPTFLALDADAVARVQAAVTADFELEEEVRGDDRTIGIYKRR